MRTTIDDISELNTLGPADRIVAPANLFSGADGPFAILTAAFREALIEGREPRSVFLNLAEGTDPDAVLPPDVEVVRTAVDDDDTSALVCATTREQARAVADGMRARARDLTSPVDTRVVGQYL